MVWLKSASCLLLPLSLVTLTTAAVNYSARSKSLRRQHTQLIKLPSRDSSSPSSVCLPLRLDSSFSTSSTPAPTRGLSDGQVGHFNPLGPKRPALPSPVLSVQNNHQFYLHLYHSCNSPLQVKSLSNLYTFSPSTGCKCLLLSLLLLLLPLVTLSCISPGISKLISDTNQVIYTEVQRVLVEYIHVILLLPVSGERVKKSKEIYPKGGNNYTNCRRSVTSEYSSTYLRKRAGCKLFSSYISSYIFPLYPGASEASASARSGDSSSLGEVKLKNRLKGVIELSCQDLIT